MSVRRFGDINKATNLFRDLINNVTKAERKILKEVALKAEQLAVDRINSQPSEWKKLSPAYLRLKMGGVSSGKKRKDGKRDRRYKRYSEKMLIKTSSMIQSITSNVDGLTGYAGVTKTARNEEGESVANIAAVHEYGSVKMNIPARPVWSVVHIQIKDYILTTPTINQHLKDALLRGVK